MSSYIKKAKSKYLKLDTNQMIEVDRLMVEEYHIDLIQMMENAGRSLAILAREKFLKGKLNEKRVLIFAGTGGNGGGALVCARRLAGWGAHVTVYQTRGTSKMNVIPQHQSNILIKMNITVHSEELPPVNLKPDLIIDGIIGYNIQGDPRGLSKKMIKWANKSKVDVLSLDNPSGLDLTTGKASSTTIKAAATLTLAMPKKGLFSKDGKKMSGALYLADIGVPTILYEAKTLGLQTSGNVFRESDIVKIRS